MIPQHEILEAAKEAGLYMTSPERIAAVEKLVAIIERRNSDRIEQLERQLAERDAEISKYRDAPVVAYVNFADNGNIRIWTSASDHAMHIAEDQGFVLQRLIVKPGEQ